jgi:protein tyrosine phosphatase (PTP) superfamily phosphohydrolase (DUF442 family)
MGKSGVRRALALAVCLAAACQRAAPRDLQPVDARGLHNVYRVTDQLYSGSSPDDDAGFASLVKLGVRTIISVDGMAPDVAAAKRHALTYVHAPVGYDGIPRDKLLIIAKAARDLPGPVYVHCHHGMHRGPAAVAAIQLCNDPAWTPERAEAWMKTAGTDPRYTGLTGLPRALTKPSAAELAVPASFPEVAPVADLTRRMVEIDATWDRLKLAKSAKWAAPPGHADIDPPHEALQLVEHLREAARLEAVKVDSPLARQFADAERAAADLEAALRAKDARRAADAFAASASHCQTCHTSHRDLRNVP